MKNILNNSKRNWKTTIVGVGIIVGAILPIVGVPVATVTAIVTALGGLGLILAKDADKSGTGE